MLPTDAVALRAFYAEARARLLGDAAFARQLDAIALGPEVRTTAEAWESLVGEAASTLKLIAGHLHSGDAVLEVGGGAAFVHLWLVRAGVDVVSVEPALAGHAGAYEAGRALLAHHGVPDDRFLPLRAEDAPTLGRRFELVFSNNVLEHVADLDAVVAALAGVLAPAGRMRHNCPNYAVPYEPHFGVPLLPLVPRATAWLMPGLRGQALFEGLQFVTARRLRALGARHGLEVHFDPGVMAAAFERFADEPAFAAKHPWLAALHPWLRRTGAAALASRWPAAFGTPLHSTWSRA